MVNGGRDDLDHFEDVELTPIERKKLRKMIRDDERATWMWKTLRVWATWFAMTATFFVATFDWFVGLLKSTFSK